LLKQILKESFIYGSSRILVSLLGFLTLPYFINIFSFKDYGILTIIISINTFLPCVYSLEIETALSKFFHDSLMNKDKLLYLSIKFRTLFYLIISLPVFLILQKIINPLIPEESNILCLLIIIYGFTSSLTSIIMTFLRMSHKVKQYILIESFTTFIGTIFSIFLVAKNPTIYSYLYGSTLGKILGFLIAIYFSKINFYILLNTSIKKIRPILKFSVFLIPATIATSINSSLDIWSLTYFRSLEEVSLYSLGLKISSIANILFLILTFTFQTFSMKLIQKNKDYANSQLNKLLRYFSTFACFILILFQLLSPQIIKLIANPDYYQSSLICGILILNYIFYSYTYFSTLGSWKANKSYDYSISVIIGCMTNFLINFLFVPKFGIIGAAFATCISMLITTYSSFYLSHKRNPFNYSFKKLILTNIITIFWLNLYITNQILILNINNFIILLAFISIMIVLIINKNDLNFFKIS